MNSHEHRINTIQFGVGTIIKAQNKLKKITITINNETITLNPLLLFDYENNSEYLLSPFLCDGNVHSHGFALDQISDIQISNEDMTDECRDIVNKWSDQEIIRRFTSTSNTELLSRAKF